MADISKKSFPGSTYYHAYFPMSRDPGRTAIIKEISVIDISEDKLETVIERLVQIVCTNVSLLHLTA